MPPHLLFHPELNVGKAPARVPHRKVAHPSPQNRIDHFNYPPYGLADVSPEDLLQLPQECRPLLRLGHKMGPPLSLTTSRSDTQTPGSQISLPSIDQLSDSSPR